MSVYHKLPRLYIEHDLNDHLDVELSADQSHYLKNVLRLKERSDIRAFNGRDGEWRLSLTEISKKACQAKCIEQLRMQPLPSRKVHLFFAPIKKTRMDFLIEKAVELGATDLHPVLSERTEVRKLNEERLKAQIIEATEQCERLELPALHSVCALHEILSHDITMLVAIERVEAVTLSEKLKEHGHSEDIAVLVGPEGGFTDQEIRTLTSQKNIHPTSLGKIILRSETACCYLLACISESK